MTSDNLADFSYSSSLEWIETNGLGGYASSTVSGANTRRYHGLLVAALKPPVERRVMLSKLEETIVSGDEIYHLSSNQYPGVIHPQGYQHLESFARETFPVFKYRVGDIVLQKTIAAVHGEHTTLVLFEVLQAPREFVLELLPLYSFKDFHSMSHANDGISREYSFNNGHFRTKNYEDGKELFISVPGSEFVHSPGWYYNFEHRVEQYRGLDFQEDLFTHGKFRLELKEGSKLGIVISTEDTTGRSAFSLYDEENLRRNRLQTDLPHNKHMRRLILAADQFIANRGEGLKTIIAGYHWFSDWGRDTMIALPGLCLSTNRYDDAKKILKSFAATVSNGMLPNRFPDHGEPPEYNTVDATLWYFYSIYKYYEYTRDVHTIEELLPVLGDIIQWHYKGTRYNIHVDQDELLFSGQDGVQLTWMDAKVGSWVVTPRKGKAVEINALWYNALRIMAYLLEEIGNRSGAAFYKERAEKVITTFNEKFWNERAGCLYDVIDGDYKNNDIRPNQIYAVSLPFQLLPKEKARKVLEIVTTKLLTARGLRSLSPDFEDYKPHYGGDPWHRDSAYHQGTVWSYLLGAYVDALINVKGSKGKGEATKVLNNFLIHLDESGVGTVSEIYDAEPPHASRGCIAQAWSVAEVLRVSLEHKLYSSKNEAKSSSVEMVFI